MTLDQLFWTILFTAIGAFAVAVGAALKRRWFMCGVAAFLSAIATLVVLGGGASS